MADKEIYWHLPGFCVNFYLNQSIIMLMQKYPEKFRDGYRIGSVYGTFPGAVWNGGRAVFGIFAKYNIEQLMSTYDRLNVPVRFTWTNSLLEEKHLNDTYCNMIMDIANNGKNQVLTNTDVLENYLRKKYPNFKFISSTTKRIVDSEELKKELDKDYFMVVLDYDLNHDEEVLSSLEPVADRVEILVDEICYPHCPKRKEHYASESKAQLEFDRDSSFDCPNTKVKPSFAESKRRPQFIGNDDIGDYIDRGFCNFKLVGRGLPIDFVKDSYMYYLVKDEYRDDIRIRLESMLAKTRG